MTCLAEVIAAERLKPRRIFVVKYYDANGNVQRKFFNTRIVADIMRRGLERTRNGPISVYEIEGPPSLDELPAWLTEFLVEPWRGETL
jgi:hypothetical protein